VVTKPKHDFLKHNKTAVQIYKRAAVFLAIFIIYSGFLGPRIISHGLVNKDGFEIYGGLGKSLLFGVLALALLIYRNSKHVTLASWRKTNIIWLVLSLLTFYGAWYGVGKLISGQTGSGWPLFINASIVGSIIFALGGCFGPSNLRTLAKAYKKELKIALLLIIGFYAFLYLVYGLWQFLSGIVLHCVKWLMGILGIPSTIVLPRTLVFSKFGINIAEYCSGIESIALFSALYALVGILDWRVLNHKKYLYIFPVGLIVLLIFNILRVFILILGGYYVNPKIAFSLFHTYAGMVFFILYSLIFWAVSYKWMLQED